MIPLFLVVVPAALGIGMGPLLLVIVVPLLVDRKYVPSLSLSPPTHLFFSDTSPWHSDYTNQPKWPVQYSPSLSPLISSVAPKLHSKE